MGKPPSKSRRALRRSAGVTAARVRVLGLELRLPASEHVREHRRRVRERLREHRRREIRRRRPAPSPILDESSRAPVPDPDGDERTIANASRAAAGIAALSLEDADGLSVAAEPNRVEGSSTEDNGQQASTSVFGQQASTSSGVIRQEAATGSAALSLEDADVAADPSAEDDRVEGSSADVSGQHASTSDFGQQASTSSGVVHGEAGSAGEGTSSGEQESAGFVNKAHREAFENAMLDHRYRYHFRAYFDVVDALRIAPNDGRVIFAKALTLFETRQYAQAVQTLQGLVVMKGEDFTRPEELALYKETRKLSEDGVCTLTVWDGKLRLSGRGDYVGPVKIGFGGTPSVVGLFASRDLKAKDVILVERGTLPQEISKSPLLRRQLSIFSELRFPKPGSTKKAPNMRTFRETFKPNVSRPNDLYEEVIDVDGILRAVEWWKRLGVARVYPLAGFINHSCIPNAVFVEVTRDTRIYRAIREIRAGEEIRVSYVDLMCRRRSKALEDKGIDCECERCKMDQELADWYHGIEDAGDMSYAEAHEWSLCTPGHVEAIMRDRHIFPEGLSDEKKAWFRARYLVDYAAYYVAMYKGWFEEDVNVPRVLKFMTEFSKYHSGSLEAIRLMITKLELMEKYPMSPVDSLPPLRYAFSLVFGDQELQVYRDLQTIISENRKF